MSSSDTLTLSRRRFLGVCGACATAGVETFTSTPVAADGRGQLSTLDGVGAISAEGQAAISAVDEQLRWPGFLAGISHGEGPASGDGYMEVPFHKLQFIGASGGRTNQLTICLAHQRTNRTDAGISRWAVPTTFGIPLINTIVTIIILTVA